jgi:glycosyltransferase involved in cell wall biosynthesis
LESFAGLRSRDARARLVLTGERPGLEADLARLGLKEEVIFLGKIPNPALPGVYRGARALVFPSRYEGFGYPPLEAMGCGTPPIVSDAASLPEVVGEAGIIVPEGAAEPLRDAMLRLLSDDGLRDALGQKGRERARAFSWEKLARGTLEAYREAVAGPGRAA